MRVLRWIILVPVALILIAISVANRSAITFSLDPFNPGDPAVAVEAPLFWFLFAALALGILAGGLAAWFGQAKWRRAARQEHAEAVRLRRETERRMPAAGSLPSPADRRPVA